MSDKDATWSSDWSVGVRLWVERGRKAILGKGRLELLEGIDRWQSISAAARQMGMSYRRAWLLVQAINEAAGEPLVEASVGGTRGGGAKLTSRGRAAVSVFRDLQRHVIESAASFLPQLLEIPTTDALHLAAAVSLEEVIGQLLADYAMQQPSVRVRTVFGGSDELADHLLSGAPGDLFLTADVFQLDRLKHAGLIESESRTPLAENTLVAVATLDRSVPVKKPKDLLRPEIKRVAIAQPSCPLGKYTESCLRGLGIYEPLLARVLQLNNSRAVLAAVHAEQADVGLVYGSDSATARGCHVLFRFRRIPTPVRYWAGIIARGEQIQRARALLQFITSPHAVRRLRQCGFSGP
jgi:molybdate transport system substrate-binding protein